MLGLASASGFIGCTKVISELVSPKKYSLFVGISMFVGCLGGICGSVPTAWLVSKFGWRETTYIIASFGILLSILAAFFMANPQNKAEATSNDNQEGKLLDGVKILAKNPKYWVLGIYGAISYLPLSATAELWCTPFVEKKYGIPTSTAALSATLYIHRLWIGKYHNCRAC